MLPLGRSLILLGILLVVVGLAVSFSTRIPWLGKLPGDILIERKNFHFYFPLTSCLLISILLSLLFWLLGK